MTTKKEFLKILRETYGNDVEIKEILFNETALTPYITRITILINKIPVLQNDVSLTPIHSSERELLDLREDQWEQVIRGLLLIGFNKFIQNSDAKTPSSSS